MESFMTELRQQVQCSLCNETMTEPKLLQCFHTFCKPCIKRHAQLDGQVNVLKCPQCNSQTLLQELNDVEDLKASPLHSRILQVLTFVKRQKVCSVSASHCEASWECLDCSRSFCHECLQSHCEFIKNHKVISLTDLKKEDIEVMLKRESPCKTHTNQDVELHCQDCDMLICLLCLKDHHSQHKTMPLQAFVVEEKHLLYENLEQIQNLSANEEDKKQQEKIALMMKRDGEKAQEQVRKITKKLVKSLIDQEQQLLNEIQKSITKADRNLRMIRHTPAAQEYITNIVNNGVASDMVDNEEVNSSKKFMYNPFPTHSSGFLFEPSQGLCQQVNDGLGVLRPFKRADPRMSSLKVGSYTRWSYFKDDVEATNKAKLTIALKTSNEEVADESLDNVTIQITPEDDVILGDIQMEANGEITVDLTPRVAGQLTVQVLVNGSNVSNSPLVKPVKPQDIEEVTSDKTKKLKNALNKGSKNFKGIAVNKTNSKIAVADYSSHCVRVFNMEGDLLLTYGSEGSGHGQLKYPSGLAFLDETDLVIADRNNFRICIISTLTGKLARSFGWHGNGNGQFTGPGGVHVNEDSNIFVCDSNNRRVQVFTKDGDYQYKFSVPNGRPFDAVEHNGRFYVSNYDTSVIHVIEMNDDQSPTTVTTIDGKDYTDGQLKKPRGLAIDSDNNLLVCDRGSSIIYKFTLDGRLIGKSSQLTNEPNCLIVLNDGRIICTTEGGGVFFY